MTLPVITLGLNRPLDIEVTGITQIFWDGLAEGEFLDLPLHDLLKIQLSSAKNMIRPATAGTSNG